MKSKVYFTKNISKENLVKLFNALNIELKGNVGIKIHSGEPGGKNFLKAEFIKDLVNLVSGTIVESNTAYEGRRNTTEKHLETLKEHGFSAIAPVDVLDAEGSMELPIKNGKHLKINYVGSHLSKYDSLLILSHFKGHQMGGFGGALKNTSIGIASSYGKAIIHGAGNPDNLWKAPQIDFLESMAEAASSIIDYRKGQIAFINVMNNLSIDCDCNYAPKDPQMADIGMLASLDPVALDKACVDLIYNSVDLGKESLIKRIEEKQGLHIIQESVKLGVGTDKYEIINID